MKKFTTLLLVLALTFTTVLGVIPLNAFATAEATEITESLGGYGGGIRKKSDGSVMFSPYIYELRAMLTADTTLSLSDLTIEMTFTLLSGEDGTAVTEYDTVSAAVNQGGNNYYFDVYLRGTKGDCGFCPTAEAYYDVYVEIFKGTDKLLYGTYPSLQAAAAIADSSYYAPTEDDTTEPDIPEVTYPITIVDTSTYNGFRMNSSGNILFCPYLSTTTDIDGTTLAANAIKTALKSNANAFTASLDIYYQVGGNGSTELVKAASLSSIALKNSSNGNYLDIELLKSSVDYGFCPVAGQYYTVELNIYDENGDLAFCDGVYKNVTTNKVEQSDYYYSSEVFYAGYQASDSSIRFVGGVSDVAVLAYDKVDLEINFTNGDLDRTFNSPATTVYKTLIGTDENGNPFNAVTVPGSEVEAEEFVVAAYLFGYGITVIPEGTYTVTVKPIAYIGGTAVEGKTATYTTVTIGADGSVSVTK